MPGLSLVDDVNLAGALPVEQKPAQDPVRMEAAVPLHLDVSGVADAVRARQQCDVAERLQVQLVLDAPRHAGDPQRRGSVRRNLFELVGDVVEPGHQLRPGLRQPEPCGARRAAWQRPPLGRPGGPCDERHRLVPVAEPQLFVLGDLVEVDKLGGVADVAVVLVAVGPAPPHRLDLREHEDPDQRGERARRVLRGGLVVPDLEEKLGHGHVPAVRSSLEHRREVVLIKPLA